jgi:hypothetical protein
VLSKKNCIQIVINYAPGLILRRAMCWVATFGRLARL